MTEQEIKAEIKKAYGFFMDGTYDSSELLFSHIMQIIREEKQELVNRVSLVTHSLEKLLHLIEEYRQASYDIKNGHKRKISIRSKLGKDIDKAVTKLHALGYNTERFKKDKTEQTQIFNG